MNYLTIKLQERWYYWQFTRKQQQAFLEDLYSLVKDGVPASQAIETICEISKGASHQVATRISHILSQGKPLADGMQGWFNNAIVEIIRSGEHSGTLLSSIESATRTLTQQSNAITQLINTIVYPIAVIILALSVTVFIKHSVLLRFAEIKPIIKWPQIGQTLYHLAQFIEDGWWLIILIIVAAAVLTIKILRSLTGELRHTIDKIPPLSLYRDTTAARFMETLGLLISNGVVLKKALHTMQIDAQPYLAWHLLMMEFHLSGGLENIADILDTNLIRNNDLIRLRVVAKSKGFQHALISLGQHANQRNNRLIVMIGKISGAIFLLLGALIAITIIFGIYSVGSTITH